MHAKRDGIVIQAYSPLTRGRRLTDQTHVEIGARHGKAAAAVLLPWSLQVGAAPIPRVAAREHREANLEVLDFEPTEDEMRRLGDLNEHHSSLAGLPYV